MILARREAILLTMSHPSRAIANYFIDVASNSGGVSPMKLQKLVYFAHGWHFALYDEALLDEQIEAWQYGPVISTLYHEFKDYGNRPITRMATQFVIGEGEYRIVTPTIPDDADLKAFLDRIWEVYGDYTAIQLSNMTHEEGTPWDTVWGEHGVPRGTDIPSECIKEYFVSLRDGDD